MFLKNLVESIQPLVEIWLIWLGLKLHFTTETYDWFKYDGRVNCKLETFTKRNDRYFFYKLGTKYNEKEIINYFVANFLSDTKKWIGDLSRKNGHDQYLSWKKYNENLDYHFRSDCVLVADRLIADNLRFNDGFSVHMGQHPFTTWAATSNAFPKGPLSWVIFSIIFYNGRKKMYL